MYRDNLNLQQAKNRIESQIPINDKKQFADKILDNSKTKDFFKRQIRELL